MGQMGRERGSEKSTRWRERERMGKGEKTRAMDGTNIFGSRVRKQTKKEKVPSRSAVESVGHVKRLPPTHEPTART